MDGTSSRLWIPFDVLVESDEHIQLGWRYTQKNLRQKVDLLIFIVLQPHFFLFYYKKLIKQSICIKLCIRNKI